MARTVVGYVRAYLNNMASASPTASVEAATGLPIATGLTVGAFQEFSASEVGSLSYTAWGTLYDGTYMWVKLDPTVTTNPIPLGTALAWLETADASGQVPTVTTLNTTTASDFAGISIDSNFGSAFPYAFIQLDGKANALFDATPATAFGDVVSLSTGTQGAVTRTGAATANWIGLSVGISLVTTGVASVRNLVRIIRKQARF